MDVRNAERLIPKFWAGIGKFLSKNKALILMVLIST